MQKVKGMQQLMYWTMIAVIVHSGASRAWAESPAVAAWPQFRGINASGVADATSLPIEFGPEKNVIWSVSLPRGVSSPCIWGDRIFVTAFEPETQALQTLCLSRSNGQILWQQSAPTEQIEEVHEVSSPANATPVADEARVYVYFASFGLLCYDHQGNLLWQQDLPMPHGRFGSGTSPILINELLILNHDLMMREDAGDSYLLALNRRTGETVWKSKHDPSFTPYATPVHWHDNGKDRILLLSMGRLAAYELTDGKELWSVSDLPMQTVATPVIGDGRLYLCATGAFGEDENAVELPAFDQMVATYDKNSDGLSVDEIPEDMLLVNRHMSRNAGNSTLREFIVYGDTDKDQRISKEEWITFSQQSRQFIAQSPQGVYAIRLNDSADGERILWVDPKGVSEIPSPLFLAGRVYSVKNGGIFQCRDAATGTTAFVGRLRATGGYFASPVYGDGKIYTASDRGQVSVIKADDHLHILATNDFGEPITASPALVGNTIYIRTQSRLYACGAK
jgi:outer membrane protein assembly factor BamB